jgi:hypothetical protein
MRCNIGLGKDIIDDGESLQLPHRFNDDKKLLPRNPGFCCFAIHCPSNIQAYLA